jgi:TP901 family phage tail tape measure protein
MASQETKIINVKIKGVNDLLKLKAELKKLKKEQEKITSVNKKGEKEWIDKERAITKATQKVRKHRNELTKLDKEQRKTQKGGAGFSKGMLKMAAGITAVVATVRALSRVFVSAFKTFTEFEFSMAKVRAISGATNEEFMKLEQSAKELGRTTFFTAKEVAELQVNFSKLGFTAEQILNLQAATLDLAMATGSDLARSAMVAGSAVRGFGLDASEATRVVDVMAVSFTSSALDIEKWQTSMTKVSAIAASIGVDIEGTAAVMGSLADTGIEASIAGTSLRNIFLKMANPTSSLAKRIGFTVNSTKDMVKALKKLKTAQIGQLEMQTLVDKRQVIAMQAMIENVDTIDQYVGALNNAEGAGREMSAIMEDSTKGAFKRFTSALEGLFLVLSEKIAPWVNKVTKGTREWIEMLTGATDKKISDRMNDQVKEFQNLFTVLKKSTVLDQTKEKALKEINRKYSEYLGYQLTDINDTKALYEAEKLLNEQFAERIQLQVAEEGLGQFYKDQEKRAYDLFNLQKEIAKSPLGKLKSYEDLFSEGANVAMDDAAALWDFISDLKVKTFEDDGEIDGFMQKLELGLVFGTGVLNNLWAIPKEFIKDMDAWADFKLISDEILKLQAEIAAESKDEAYWKDRVIEAGGKIKDLLDKNKPKPCPEGQHRDSITGECVDPVAVRNFTKELAAYKVAISDKTSAEFIANEERRDMAILNKQVELAEAEFELFKNIEDQKDKYLLKLLKAREKRDRAELKRKENRLDEGLVMTKRRLAQEGRDKEHFTLELERKELLAEKRMLEKKLLLYKDYSKEWKKIRKQMEKVDEDIKVNDHESDMELKQFKVELAQEIANATFAIMSNNLARQKEASLNSLQNTYDNEMWYLDKQLEDKSISKADYDGKKLIADTKLKEEEERLNKEFARKEKNAAKAQAVINGALAITKVLAQTGTLAPFVIPMIIAATVAQLAVIESQQFAKGGIVEKFADGGMVVGKSHAQGGEKFAVGGRVVELEGGEAVINKRSTAMFGSQLSAMNAAGGGVKFADGGLLNKSSFSSARFNSAGFNSSQGGGGRVVVVESDITTSQRKVRAIENNASF